MVGEGQSVYYLNHVGYKAKLCLQERSALGLYYLNHVGYKVAYV